MRFYTKQSEFERKALSYRVQTAKFLSSIDKARLEKAQIHCELRFRVRNIERVFILVSRNKKIYFAFPRSLKVAQSLELCRKVRQLSSE